jgi:hypothetical protein
VAKVEEYLRTRTTQPLVWLIASTCLLFACFTIPRIAIPVTVGYGDNFCWDLSTASHFGYVQNLRHFLSGWPDSAKLINIVFSLCSYWLPALLLVTPSRMRIVLKRMSHLRQATVAHVVMVLALSAIGGTNIMIFVVYTGPVMAIILTMLLATDLHPSEVVLMLAVVCVFNRIPWVIGGMSTAEDIMSFYAGWGTVADMTTLHRSLEMALYLALFIALRFILDRSSRNAAGVPA